MLDVMINDVWCGLETPLADWLTDHPEDYPNLCDYIQRSRNFYEPTVLFPDWIWEDRYTLRDRLRIHQEVIKKLLEIRDRAAEMLGYEDRPRDPWEEDEYFGYVLFIDDLVLDPQLFPREDEFGLPIT